MKKNILLVFLILTSFVFSAEMETILDLDINERANGTSKDKVWKEFKFTMPYKSKVEIKVVAIARDNGTRNDDDIKWGLNNEDFGWATSRAWDGRELKGNPKTVTLTKELLKGDHYIKFWVDQRPTLNSVTVKMEKKNLVTTPNIITNQFIKGAGFKLEWEKQKKDYEYVVMRKDGESNYDKVANVSSNAYIDTSIEDGKVYKYKVGIMRDSSKIIDYTEEVEIDLTKKSKPRELKSEIIDEQIKLTWKMENKEEIANYNIYRKKTSNTGFRKYSLAISETFTDNKVEPGIEYLYKISAVFLNGTESEQSDTITAKIKKAYRPTGTVDWYPEELVAGEMATIYFSDRRSKQIRTARRKSKRRDPNISSLPEQMYIHYGFNNWDPDHTIDEADDPKMTYDEEINYWKYEMKIPGYATEFDFVFKDEIDNWDTNWAKDYKVSVKGDSVPPVLPEEINIEGKKDLVFLTWEKPDIDDLNFYEILKSDNSDMEDAETIKISSEKTYYIDRDLDYYMNDSGDWDNRYYYQMKSVDYSGNESSLSEVFEGIPKSTGVSYTEKFDWEPQEPERGDNVTIYFKKESGPLSDVDDIYARVGFNNWQTQNDELVEMKYDEVFEVYYIEEEVKPGVNSINVAFTDEEQQNWDRNNWTVNVKPDTNPPEKVENLDRGVYSGKVEISWEENMDEDLAGYNIYRNGKQLNSELLETNVFTDEDIEENTKYLYSVTAVDLSGNESERNEIIVNTLKDIITTPPEAIYNTTLDNLPLKLIASVDERVDWAVDILNSDGEVIREYNGKGSNVIILWNGRDNKNNLIEPGLYKYRVRVLSIEGVGEKEVKMVISE
ncbi:MAG: hypothetical protein ACQERZ_07665 [Fusobacteriota bacterium]